MKSRSSYKFIFMLLGLFLISLFFQQNILNLRLLMVGSAVPRNSREQVIFDYFNYLKESNYQSAYQLLSEDYRGSYSFFTSSVATSNRELPQMITIGKERLRMNDYNASDCNYGYTVYVIDPGNFTLIAGEVGMEQSKNGSKLCVIRYNSAFGGI